MNMKTLLKPVVKFINCLYAYCSKNIIYPLAMGGSGTPRAPWSTIGIHADPFRGIMYPLFSYNKIHGKNKPVSLWLVYSIINVFWLSQVHVHVCIPISKSSHTFLNAPSIAKHLELEPHITPLEYIIANLTITGGRSDVTLW